MVCLQLPSILILIYLSTSLTALKHNADIVVIESLHFDPDNLDDSESFEDDKTMTPDQLNCKTTRGEPGICAPLSHCYPILYTAAIDDGVRNLSKLALAKQLMIMSGPCSQNEEDYLANMICCSTFFPKLKTELNSPIKNVPKNRLKLDPCFPPLSKETGHVQATPHSYPWMAALIRNGRAFCGGSLITPLHILTAAHCVSHFKPTELKSLKIFLGVHDVTLASEPHRQTRRVKRIFYHEGFNHQFLHNDIAVIQLAWPIVDFNDQVQQICLTTGQPPYDINYQMAYTAGWGQLNETLSQPPTLYQVPVRVLPQKKCQKKYSRVVGQITDQMVCAAASGGSGHDACEGYSGGPLMRRRDTRMEQIGIVSFGIGCGTLPTIYTRVDKYRDWLTRSINWP